ncbi:MAG: response regulator [Alphaproteobacteria bacterium]
MKEEIIHLLIVDDDDRIRKLLRKYLKENGFLVSVAQDAAETINLVQEFIFDLIILDVMMPGKDGYTLASELKNQLTVPILMLTAMGEVESRIKGFEAGVDDYLVKPFEPRELLFRINNIISKTKIIQNKLNSNYVYFGNLKYDLANNRLTKDDITVNLTTAEAKLLSILISNKEKIISREKLAMLCSGINERSIDVQIIRLRNKIEVDPKKPYFLQTIRGEGYVFYT